MYTVDGRRARRGARRLYTHRARIRWCGASFARSPCSPLAARFPAHVETGAGRLKARSRAAGSSVVEAASERRNYFRVPEPSRSCRKSAIKSAAPMVRELVRSIDARSIARPRSGAKAGPERRRGPSWRDGSMPHRPWLAHPPWPCEGGGCAHGVSANLNGCGATRRGTSLSGCPSWRPRYTASEHSCCFMPHERCR